MRNLLVISFLLLGALAYGQALETVVPVGSGANNRGGDSKKVTQTKTAASIDRLNTITIEDSTINAAEANLTDDLNIVASFAGLLGTKVTNTYSGAAVVAGAVHQLTNDQGYWSLIGHTNSGSTILGGMFANTFHIYNQGYANTLNTVDGNKYFKWYTDPTDSHDFSALGNEVMSLGPDGTLDVDSGNFNAIHYTDTYYEDLRVPLTNTRINPANSEPDFEDRGDGLFAWGFDSDSDSSYILNFTAQGAHARADSTDEEGHFHWQPDGTNTGDVLWRLVYSMANEGSDWTPIDTLWAVDAADGVALKHQIIDFGTLAGSDTMRISHAIVGNVCRVGEDARDTYTGTAFGIELDFHYQIDGPGSKEEHVKY